VSDTSRLKLFILRLLDAFTVSVFAKDVTFSFPQCIEQSLYQLTISGSELSSFLRGPNKAAQEWHALVTSVNRVLCVYLLGCPNERRMR
jgi:hypothetical protein